MSNVIRTIPPIIQILGMYTIKLIYLYNLITIIYKSQIHKSIRINFFEINLNVEGFNVR